jgi:uncharacterized protein
MPPTRRHYAIVARDRPGAAAIRQAARADHLAHVEANMDRYAVAGPLRDEVGDIIGSLLIVYADSAVEARAFLSLDPYFIVDLWGDIAIDAFNPAAGDWVGGKTW